MGAEADLSPPLLIYLFFFPIFVDSHSEKTLQQRRQLVLETGDLLERNRSNLEQHRAEERNRRIEERARAHQERWAATVERHVTRQRREEGARDELILLLSKEEEVYH